MPPSVEFDLGFDEDLDDATTYLVRASVDAAEQFADLFEAAVERLLTFPHAGRPSQNGTRTLRIDKGPYSLIYLVSQDASYVRFIALAHSSRRPGYWRDRL